MDKQQRFFIPERLPGMNEMIDARLRFFTIKKGRQHIRISKYDNLKKKTERVITECIKGALLKPMNYVNVLFCWVEPKRNRDKDNIAAGKKFIFDALMTTGIIKGDGWRHVSGFSDDFVVNKDKPGVWVTLEEVCDDTD